MSHKHYPKDLPGYAAAPTCSFRTKAECDDYFADYQAAQQVALAALVVEQGRAQMFRRDNTVFGQLVQVLAGDKDTITAGDGEESRASFTKRVLAMLVRYQQEGSNAST